MVETDLEERGGEPRTFAVKAGDLVHIPTSVFHQTVNTGAQTMELLAVYSPCGPEEVIRALPDHRELPAAPWPSGTRS
jgi:oxalate decarboxylase/phosphoglucose isomerase-like protein (cupin superfamily)